MTVRMRTKKEKEGATALFFFEHFVYLGNLRKFTPQYCEIG